MCFFCEIISMRAAMKKNYQKTLTACYLGFVTQAISANFAPLLFLRFHTEFHISLGTVALISTVFYFTQLLVDVFCAKFVDAIGYRRSVVASEAASVIGLLGLAVLPGLFQKPFYMRCDLCGRERPDRSSGKSPRGSLPL